ncbi:MAG: hypothetical protein VW577_06920 [Pelagibacteraceae bacterium]
MNAIEFLVYFINVMVSCSALPMMETTVRGEHFQVRSWVCQIDKGPVTVKAWTRQCETDSGAVYWGRTHYLAYEELQTAAYLNRFGELHIGQGAQLEEAYLPSCGS